MELFKNRSSLHGYVMFMFLMTLSKGFACEAPSSPQCFRRKAEATVYTCEWSLNTTQSDVTFELYFNETKFGNIKETFYNVVEEQLIQSRSVMIWVEAHIGNSTCKSPKTSVILQDIVKYEAPQKISASWLKNNLSLSWIATEKYPAVAEVWFRRDEHPTEPWGKRIISTTINDNKDQHQVFVVNLWKNSAYQVQIRHRSTIAKKPLWSPWSQVVVPAELVHEPNVTMTITHFNGTRKVTLTWMPMPLGAAVRNVTSYSSQRCICTKTVYHNKHTIYTFVSYSAANISVIARNDVSVSPPATLQVPVEPASDLEACNKTLADKEINRKTCLEWYELQDGSPVPKNVITLTGKMGRKKKEEVRKNLKDYIRYLYFEHRCQHGRPQTVKMCFFYQKEGVPLKEPQEVTTLHETDISADLSWKAIPLAYQQGFLTHYRLCWVKISSQDEPRVCDNIPASETKYHLENLKAGSKYNITLAGVTQVGEGPEATAIINTKPGKPMNVWLSFGLLFVFFLFSTTCTVVLKKIKVKIFPPVPKPVITDFIPHQSKTQEILEKKEEVHDELTLLKLYPEGKSVSEEAEDVRVLRDEWGDGTDEDMEHDRSTLEECSDDCSSPGSTDEEQRNSKEGEITDIEQVDNELAMLIYKNGLVFDMKTELP
ncbi:interleukin-12 receptor subunit beta-1 [Oreochromis niloticus]|uniref:Interleukin-12 receptor subunit beta-1 n=1 Tax=Oreochromis niloticus TaxID=8128 RepID=A0A669DV93_ORENI|nr:interleukin-12 receptor subunit beta-1 [Oreochromis niloticus]